jgi:hypothetical protein
MIAELVERALHGARVNGVTTNLSRSSGLARASASQIGRLQLLRGDSEAARRALTQSLQLVRSERWLAFLPWPESFSAELDALDGRTQQAERRLTEAFALACQLGDPCWEGVTARGLGLLEFRHDPDAVLARFGDALARCMRWPDAYQPALLTGLFDLMGETVSEYKLTFRQRAILVAACASAFGDSYCTLAFGSKLAAVGG